MLGSLRINDPYTVAIFSAFFIGYFISFMLGVAIFIVASICAKHVNLWGYLFFIFIISIIAFTNYSNTADGDYDINRYYSYYTRLYDCRSLPDLAFMLYDSRDTMFYFIVWLSTFVLPEDPRWFGFFFTALTSLLLLFSFFNISKKVFKEDIVCNKMSLCLFCLGFLLVIRFVDFTNGYRQHFAFALFLFFYSLNVKSVFKAILMLLTCFIHSSNFMLVAILLGLKASGIYKNTRWLFFLCAFFGFLVLGLIALILGANNHYTSYLLGPEELGVDNKIRVIMIVTTLLYTLFFKKYYYATQGSNYIKQNPFSDIYMFASLFLAISLAFVSRSTLMIRFAFDWTDFLVVTSPITYHLLKGNKFIIVKYPKTKNFQNFRYALTIIWLLFGMYNFLKIGTGKFEYMLFSTYGVFVPINSIINSTLPAGLI